MSTVSSSTNLDWVLGRQKTPAEGSAGNVFGLSSTIHVKYETLSFFSYVHPEHPKNYLTGQLIIIVIHLKTVSYADNTPKKLFRQFLCCKFMVHTYQSTFVTRTIIS